MDTAEADIEAHRVAGRTGPLSSAQERLFLLDAMMPGLGAYNVPTLNRVDGRLDGELVRRGLELVVSRHEVLRTRIDLVDGVPVAEVMPSAAFALREMDFSGGDRETAAQQARSALAALAGEPFDLGGDVLLRAALVHLPEDEDWLLTVLHHIASDHASNAILLSELDQAYLALADGQAPLLPELPTQYGDYAVRQRARLASSETAELIDYWVRHLEGAPATVTLPTDRPRPVAQSYRGELITFALEPDLAHALRAQSRSQGVSLFVTLQAAFDALLARYTGSEDIVIGTPMSGRLDEDTLPLIGCFTNTLPLRTDLSGDPTFAELVARVAVTTREAQINQELPFERLVEVLNPPRDPSYSPIYQVMFAFDVASSAPATLGGAPRSALPVPGWEWARFDLTLTLRDQPNGSLHGQLEYASDLFDAARMHAFIGHYCTLLRDAAAAPHRRISELEMLTAAERHELLVQRNRTERAYDRRPVHELISEQARRTPDAQAALDADGSCRYGELERRSNQLAHALRDCGLQVGDRVGLCAERGIEMLVGLLGILKTGAAYVPIDPGYPPSRQELMLADSGARVLLTQERYLGMLDPGAARVMCLDRDWSAIEAQSDTPPSVAVDAEALAYVIYTSGSTGTPKGVEVSHRALVNFLSAMRERPGLDNSDVLLAVTTLSFDIAGLELYLPLLVGARVVIAPAEATMDGVELADWLARHGATFMQATPTTWQLLIDAGWKGNSGLRIACGGEPLAHGLAVELLDRCDALWHMYGPTETTIWSSVHQLTRERPAPVLGGPIANTTFYVLDGHGSPVPVGVPGELSIGGDGVAAGYHGRPELTGERFVSDRFREDGSRVYRTGDLVRWRADGTLDFVGRIDHQVKLRGFRIELGEIESVLRSQPGVAGAVAVVREDVPGDRRLVAYVQPEPDGAGAVESWRGALKAALPPYMVPSAFVLVERFPTTPNGKLDRSSLPAPDGSRPAVSPFVVPETPMQESIAAIWAEVLGVERVGAQDDYFDLGGHSLLAVKMLARIHDDLGIVVALRDVFTHSTLRELADLCSAQMLGDADDEELADLLAELEGPV